VAVPGVAAFRLQLPSFRTGGPTIRCRPGREADPASPHRPQKSRRAARRTRPHRPDEKLPDPRRADSVEVPRQDDVVLQHPSPAPPPQSRPVRFIHIWLSFPRTREPSVLFANDAGSRSRETRPSPIRVARTRRGDDLSDLYRTPDHDFLDLSYGFPRIQGFRPHGDPIHERMTAEQPVGILEIVEPLVERLVARVGDEPVRGK